MPRRSSLNDVRPPLKLELSREMNLERSKGVQVYDVGKASV